MSFISLAVVVCLFVIFFFILFIVFSLRCRGEYLPVTGGSLLVARVVNLWFIYNQFVIVISALTIRECQ